MPRELLTLKEWARSIYGDAAPSISTLRRWARDARIVPPPEKHGRTYFVQPGARYVDRSVAVGRPRPRMAPPPRRGRLLERITDGGKTS